MHLVLPLGGRGTRMRPHSLHRPKALFRLAGQSVLDHVLDALGGLDIDRATFIVGPDGAAIEAWAGARCPWPSAFVLQAEPSGQAAAIALARERLSGPTLVVFADTLFEIDPADLIGPPAEVDGLLFLRRVADPSALGVALLDAEGRVTRLIEKPREPVSDLAVMGLYWLREGRALLAAIDRLMASGKQTRGEYFVADALQGMIEDGARFEARPVRAWHEAGSLTDSLEAQRHLLERRLAPEQAAAREAEGCADPRTLRQRYPGSRFVAPVFVADGAEIDGSHIGPRVWVEQGCRITDSQLGPDISLGAGSRVRDCRLRDLIADRDCRLEGCDLHDSVLGRRVRLKGARGVLNLGDDASGTL